MSGNLPAEAGWGEASALGDSDKQETPPPELEVN